MSIQRRHVSGGSPYEGMIGFSRAVRLGSIVAVAGTGPIGRDGKTIGAGDAEVQARRCLEIIEQALKEAGAGLEDVIRTRTFLTDISNWEAVGRVHGEFFGEVRLASTMVEVSRFIDPDWLVEMEAEAVLKDDPDDWQNAWAPSGEEGTET